MKTVQSNQNVNNQKGNNNNRPENKDNLDSRKNEEFDFKGNDVTHNKKETHSEHKKGNHK